MESVLKLSCSYEPLAIIKGKKALKLIALNKAEVIEEYNSKINTSGNAITMPAVIRLVKPFKRPHNKVRYNKQNVFARDHWTCGYCSQKFNIKDLTLDHVIPRSKGGKTSFENVITCCKECNLRKGNRSPQDANMVLKRKPAVPDWLPLLSFKISVNAVPEIWANYCFLGK